jgi:prepilin-type N-terminal cleavage/methylation domain-containing protein
VVNQRGFTLVEVLVAIMLLSVAVLTLAASGALAAGLIRSAQREEAATRLAAALLDSLLMEPSPSSGTAIEGSLTAVWSGPPLTLSVSYRDAGRVRVYTWEARGLPAARETGTANRVQP